MKTFLRMWLARFVPCVVGVVTYFALSWIWDITLIISVSSYITYLLLAIFLSAILSGLVALYDLVKRRIRNEGKSVNHDNNM